MSVQVKSLDEHKAKEVLKTCPKIIKDYVKALKSAIEGSQNTTNKAISKIKEQHQQNKALLKENSKLVQTVAEWSALAIDRKQDLDASLKEVKELKDEKTNSVSAEKHNRIIREQEERLDELITNLKQQLEESKKENERFDEYIDYYKNSTETTPHSFEVWKENY